VSSFIHLQGPHFLLALHVTRFIVFSWHFFGKTFRFWLSIDNRRRACSQGERQLPTLKERTLLVGWVWGGGEELSKKQISTLSFMLMEIDEQTCHVWPKKVYE